MIPADVKERTACLLAEYLCYSINPQRFVEWAVYLLKQGIETDDILILAGLDHYPREEIEAYFWRCVDDLKLKPEKSDTALIQDLAMHIAGKVVADKLNPSEGLKKMVSLTINLDYPVNLEQFYTLDEDISYLDYYDTTRINDFNQTTDLNGVIRHEFELFLRAEKLNLADKYREYAYCLNCKSLNAPALRPKRNWFGKVKYKYWACPGCGSSRIKHFESQQGRDLILTALEKRNAS